MSSETRLRAIRACQQAGEALRFIFFWGHEALSPALGCECLSQWYPSCIEHDGVQFATAEHFMMAGKARLFGDEDIFRQIAYSSDPLDALMLGRRVHGFDEAVWQRERYGIVLEGNRLKFAQHPALAYYLRDTQDAVLASATPMELVWGIGLSPKHRDAANPAAWRGLNLLGFALMSVREAL